LVVVRRADRGLVRLDTLSGLAAGGRARVVVRVGAWRTVLLRRMRTQSRRRVTRQVVGALVAVRRAGERQVGLGTAADGVAAGGRAGVAVGVGARRAVGLVRRHALAGVLIAGRVGALGIGARRTERDGAALRAARGEDEVVAYRIQGRVPADLLDEVGGGVDARGV